MFFQTWPLWEKMTFILALAISCVFVLGWIKVVWRFRTNKKREIFDEEKRLRIQHLKKNGLIADSQVKQEIPFGVRAIQSGIQVDGIWISNPNTPVPSELTLASFPGESSDDSAKNSHKLPGETVVQAKSKPKPRVRPIVRQEGMANRRHPEILQEISEGHATRPSYKPRRSSQLRFSDHGDYDEETLNQLQGAVSPKNKTYIVRPRGSQNTHDDPDSSAADNERNSGTSDDSDATLSHDTTLTAASPGKNTLKLPSESATSRLSGGTLPKSEIPGSDSQTLNTQGYTICENLPRVDYLFSGQSEPIVDRDLSPIPYQVRPPEERSASPFVPGELHMNKLSRKVNPGFEVLPAGTFGAPAEFNTLLESDVVEFPKDKRPSTKLQKKPRNPSTGHPSTLEGP
ncbi:hypothetical protein K3495_g10526 [Podosphaera aphanis]|nr:hypothetical protein K3495_g10526 [Podosphaera aphanis]